MLSRADTSIDQKAQLQTNVAEIWADVLGVETIGFDANFLDLGGTSFSAIEIAERLSLLIGQELPMTVVFEAPTVRELAAMLATSFSR
jgi:acyl carrier protein